MMVSSGVVPCLLIAATGTMRDLRPFPCTAGTPYRARREWRRKSALVGTVLLIPSHASQLPGSEAAGAPRPRAGRIKLLSS